MKIKATQEAKHLLEQITFADYKDFNSLPCDITTTLKNLKERVQKDIQEIIILTIQEDINLDKSREKKLPSELQRFLNFTEGRGLKYYIFKTEDAISGVFLGASGGTTPRTNEFYMQELIKDEALQSKVRAIETSYQAFLDGQ